jgi:phage regulator Rha-like protein
LTVGFQLANSEAHVCVRLLFLRSQIATSKTGEFKDGRIMRKGEMAVVKPVESRILVLRGHKVILDSDLAALYGVSVKRLNEQVKRNAERFPADFMFQLSAKEHDYLKSQIATSNKGRGGRRYPPYVFTEHGAIMAATALNSKRAVEMSLFVVRAFVRLRETLSRNRQVAAKLSELERKLKGHDTAIQDLIDAIQEMMSPEPAKQRRIGFKLPGKLPEKSG